MLYAELVRSLSSLPSHLFLVASIQSAPRIFPSIPVGSGLFTVAESRRADGSGPKADGRFDGCDERASFLRLHGVSFDAFERWHDADFCPNRLLYVSRRRGGVVAAETRCVVRRVASLWIISPPVHLRKLLAGRFAASRRRWPMDGVLRLTLWGRRLTIVLGRCVRGASGT